MKNKLNQIIKKVKSTRAFTLLEMAITETIQNSK